jgi:hypothetical protein
MPMCPTSNSKYLLAEYPISVFLSKTERSPEGNKMFSELVLLKM